MSCLIELHYLPSIEYFTEISKHKKVTLERHEHFVKQSYRSRCYINTSKGIETLIVPLTAKHNKAVITDVQIDYSQKWLNNHWRTIQSAYGKSPFFEFYSDALHASLRKPHKFLYDLNYELLTLCLKWLKLDISIEESLAYDKNVSPTTIDLRNVIQAKNRGSSENLFPTQSYTQVFGNAFVNNTSLVDLIFCTGPQALTYLRKRV